MLKVIKKDEFTGVKSYSAARRFIHKKFHELKDKVFPYGLSNIRLIGTALENGKRYWAVRVTYKMSKKDEKAGFYINFHIYQYWKIFSDKWELYEFNYKPTRDVMRKMEYKLLNCNKEG